MIDRKTAFQTAQYRTLIEFPRLIELFGGEEPKVWDFVRRDDQGKPVGGTAYIKIGEDQIVGEEETEDYRAFVVYSTVKVYDEPTDGSGKEWIAPASEAVKDALVSPQGFETFAANLEELGYLCTLGVCTDARHSDPADGLTEQAVLTFRFEVDPRPGT